MTVTRALCLGVMHRVKKADVIGMRSIVMNRVITVIMTLTCSGPSGCVDRSSIVAVMTNSVTAVVEWVLLTGLLVFSANRQVVHVDAV